jgi:hypothetical protein
MQLSACAKELLWAACPKATATNPLKHSFRRDSRGPIPNFSASLAVYVSNRLKHRRPIRWPTNRYYQQLLYCTLAK